MANWWEEKPLRLVQTNLRQLDAQRDPREIIRQVKDLHANTILFSVGGIVSFYPTQLEFQTPIPDLKGDFVGEAVDEAHKQGIRFLARIDLSKCHKHVYVSHPEWFYLRANGQPVLYNGLYATCVNGAYYRDYALEIVQEILGRYPVDGFFFNMFSYRTTDYSGEYSGLCYCPTCVRRFQEMYGRALPKAEELRDPAYRDFMEFQWIITDEVTAKITDFVHQQRDSVAVAHGSPPVMRTPTIQHADIIRSESGFGWQYSASDNVKKIRGSYPATPISNSANYFRNIPHRFAAVSPHQIGLRLAQDMANGAGTDLYVLGTLDQEDRSALQPAKAFFQFLEEHEDLYHNLSSLAKVALVMPVQSFTYGIRGEGLFHGVEDGYRAMFNLMQGTFRLLTESHIPFDTIYDFSLNGDDGARLLARYDLLVLPGAACLSDQQAKAIDHFVHRGGRVLAIGETGLYNERAEAQGTCNLECLGIREVSFRQSSMRSAYIRIRDGERLGLLDDTDLVPLDGRYLYCSLKEGATTLWTVVPPAMFGPPEFCFLDKIESALPGVIRYAYGQGKSAFFPWNIDLLYDANAMPGHEKMLQAVIFDLLDGQRQIATDAHPAVEMALFQHPGGDCVLNLVNSSGYMPPTVRAPLAMQNIEIKVKLPRVARTARTIVSGEELSLRQEGGYACFTLRRLELFETVVIKLGA